MAEAYGLWQGIKLLLNKRVEEVMIFGDSRVIIQAMNSRKKCNNNRTARLIRRIRSNIKLFRSVRFLHILRNLNGLADTAANKSIALGLHDLSVNLVISSDIPP